MNGAWREFWCSLRRPWWRPWHRWDEWGPGCASPGARLEMAQPGKPAPWFQHRMCLNCRHAQMRRVWWV